MCNADCGLAIALNLGLTGEGAPSRFAGSGGLWDI